MEGYIMQVVQPIRDLRKIHQIEKILKKQSMRNYLLFRIGIYSGLRISDILKLKVKDLRGQTHFTLREQKTGKAQKLKIQPDLRREIEEYIKDKDDEEYLFKSQKGKNSPIQRIQAWRILNDAAKQVGINGEIGCHTLRKTFGYHFYKYSGGDIAILQKIFNHSSSQVTLRYIGILQDEIDKLIDGFNYRKLRR